ncbi:hypothetical protein PanWU01x14_077370 [Parasponia andersonii]|uniref:Uncharacterized protein n=1 Tax=Parasponia andersonii TaxID=3476 RepID=A0A2P5DBN2_PARAD|nr:hypothetical protein PanWU01x14_077370 [Parasponia andersonii]
MAVGRWWKSSNSSPPSLEINRERGMRFVKTEGKVVFIEAKGGAARNGCCRIYYRFGEPTF